MYKDINEVIHATEVPRELWEFEELMREVPKFNRKSNFDIRKVQSRTRTGYIVVNKNKKFKDGHTHLKNHKLCKLAIHYVENEKIPKNKNIYFLSSLIRLSTNKRYIDQVEQVICENKKMRLK